MRYRASCLTIALALAIPALLAAQNPPPLPQLRVVDSTHIQVIRTTDGSTIVGHVTAIDGDTVRFVTRAGTLALLRSQIKSIQETRPKSVHNGEVWFPSPNESRLFFAPTGRMLAHGEGYFSDTYLFFLQAAGGVTDRLTLGGGFSVFPTSDFSDNVFYVLPKLGVVASDRVNIAVGALAAYAGFADSGEESFGILYGVGTLGSPDANVTLGAGLGYQGSDLASRPVFMLGGEKRVSRRVSLMTENYVGKFEETEAVFLYGFRFFGEKLSVDLAFANATAADEFIFPGIPFVAFAIKF